MNGSQWDKDINSNNRNSVDLQSLGGFEDEGKRNAFYHKFYEEDLNKPPIVLTNAMEFREYKLFKIALKEYSIKIGFDYA